jgi:hypothetical protein
MGSKSVRRISAVLVAAFFCLGYRVYPGITGWNLNPSVTASRKVFITLRLTGKVFSNNLPTNDRLGASGPTLTETQLLQSVIDDYNSIQKSHLILALDIDTDFAANSQNKRIEIEKGSASGESSGEAQLTFSGQYITGCKIKLTDKAYESAKVYVGLVTHEIGHCIGLEHPQETVWSVMSYFYNEEVYRLATDDKMGIVHLYPKDPADALEKATLGLSCSTI